MRQHEVVIDLEQRQLIPQARFALAQRVHPASNRRDALADVEVKPFDKCGIDASSHMLAKICSMASRVPNTTRCLTPTMRRRRYDFTTWA